MLTISSAQYSAFAEAAIADFTEEAMDLVTKVLAESPERSRALSSEDLREFCLERISQGQGIGLRQRDHLLAYLKTAALFGAEFFDLVSVRMVMEDEFLSSDEKIEFLVVVTAAIWAQQGEVADELT